MLPQLYEFRDNVVRGASIALGDVVLDVGCGDGLLGIGALPRVGDAGVVIFSDVSTDLLSRCRELVTELGFSTGAVSWRPVYQTFPRYRPGPWMSS
ncbi:MAG: hypothetical protein GEV12_21765 [Micromonosporaceae bacterium]|nr:hypothetical protein [Micromonosporaceae bacterium]